MLITETVLQLAARSINSLLRLDLEWLDELAALSGSVVRVNVQGLGLVFDITIIDDGIGLRGADFDVQPGVSVSGAPFSLLALLLSGDTQQSLRTGDIHIEGNMHLADKLSRLAGSLDIDWEEWLAQRTGDLAAHQLGRLGRGFLGWRRHLHEELSAAAGEYLKEEAGHLPTRVETEQFMDGVDALRDATERLEARINVLRKNRVPSI